MGSESGYALKLNSFPQGVSITAPTRQIVAREQIPRVIGRLRGEKVSHIVIGELRDPFVGCEKTFLTTVALLETLQMLPGSIHITLHSSSPLLLIAIPLLRGFGQRLRICLTHHTALDGELKNTEEILNELGFSVQRMHKVSRQLSHSAPQEQNPTLTSHAA